MKILILCLIVGLSNSVLAENTELVKEKEKFETKIISKGNEGLEVEIPPKKLFSLIQYRSTVGLLPAYISKPKDSNIKNPAIIWLVGGMSNGISSTSWAEMPRENDQTGSIFRKKGIVTMYVSRRGGNNNPGNNESFYGEVDDVIAAAKYLAQLDYIDSNRIYLGGHSTGGTLALLIAESTDVFKSVFVLGAVASVSDYGQESLNYDTSIVIENNLRAPIEWLHTIKSPTFIFEGFDGNILSLLELFGVNTNSLVKYYPINGYDHFSLIYPLSSLIADKINSDTGNSVIVFDKKELLNKLNNIVK